MDVQSNVVGRHAHLSLLLLSVGSGPVVESTPPECSRRPQLVTETPSLRYSLPSAFCDSACTGRTSVLGMRHGSQDTNPLPETFSQKGMPKIWFLRFGTTRSTSHFFPTVTTENTFFFLSKVYVKVLRAQDVVPFCALSGCTPLPF